MFADPSGFQPPWWENGYHWHTTPNSSLFDPITEDTDPGYITHTATNVAGQTGQEAANLYASTNVLANGFTAATGRNNRGDRVSLLDQGLAGASVVLPFLKLANLPGKLGKAAEALRRTGSTHVSTREEAGELFIDYLAQNIEIQLG